MNPRWFSTILANLLLFGILLHFRPLRSRWIWASQSFVLACTAINVWDWYNLSDAHYNLVWGILDVAQSWFEGNVMVRLIPRNEFVAFILATHLFTWMLEYQGWDSILAETQEIIVLRQNLNLICIAALCICVYRRRQRYLRTEAVYEL